MALGPSVLLTTEDSYPYHRGGVSAWCDVLTSKLSEVDFTIFAITKTPYVAPQYDLAPNVREVITVPIWGTSDPAEYGHHAHFLEYLGRRWGTTTRTIEKEYLPAFRDLLIEILHPTLPARRLGLLLLRLHQYLRAHDYHLTQTHPAVWATFAAVTQRVWHERYPQIPPPTAAEVVEAWRALYRLLLPLAVKLARVDMTHSTGAGFGGLPCVVMKLVWGTPYLITEHDTYVRDRYLHLSRTTTSAFVRWFLYRFIRTVVDVNYAFADQIRPTCHYIARWPKRRQVDAGRVRVIYTGADPIRFSPASAPRRRPERPTVVSVGSIDPLKGQLDLIDAAARVRQTMPDIEFRIYGLASDGRYLRECHDRIQTHELEGHMAVSGPTAAPWSIYRDSDVVVFSGISESLPAELVEAMLSGSAIVATDVGGVREALGAAGVLVPPKDPSALAEAISSLLQTPNERYTLGLQARDRALHWFTEQRFVDAYRTSYTRLLTPDLAVPRDEQTDDEIDVETWQQLPRDVALA
jgi:glycosyltransferase involved in cell wall biosynthesis